MRLIKQLPDYGPIHIFSPTIWKYQYKFDWQNLEHKVLTSFSQLQHNSLLEKGNAWSTVGLPANEQPHNWLELKDFLEWLKITTTGIAASLYFQKFEFTITNSWINKHSASGETIEHNHNNCSFVASCYLKCPENSGNIVFKDPLEYHKSHWPIFPEEHLYDEVPVYTFDVLIFPGYLKHFVTPNLSNDDRYVLTVNIL